MVMDFCGKKTLEDYIEGKQKIPPTIMKLIIQQLLKILSHVHSWGIVHRDVKPTNIVFDDNHKLFLVDFNLAKHVEMLQDEERYSKFNIGFSSPKCSYLYAAPELHLPGLEYNESVDIFSVGMILYILIFGSKNFKAVKQGKDCTSSKSLKQLQ